MDSNNQNQEKSDGAILGSIIIITIIVFGGTYLLQNKLETIRQERVRYQNSANLISSEDDLNSIQTDLNNNKDIGNIDNNLQ